MAKFNIDLWKYSDKIEKQLVEGINDSTIILLSDIIQKSPVDSWKYLKWNKRKTASKEWNKIIWKVYNDCEYAEDVEVWFRSTPVNWYKNRKKWWPVILPNSQGARVYTRSFTENEQEIKNILKSKIKLW